MELFYIKGISLIAVSGPAGYLYPNGGYPDMTMDDRYAADRNSAHMLSLMAAGRLEPKRLITHRFHYADMVNAYEMAYKHEKSMLGVVFNWQD